MSKQAGRFTIKLVPHRDATELATLIEETCSCHRKLYLDNVKGTTLVDTIAQHCKQRWRAAFTGRFDEARFVLQTAQQHGAFAIPKDWRLQRLSEEIHDPSASTSCEIRLEYCLEPEPKLASMFAPRADAAEAAGPAASEVAAVHEEATAAAAAAEAAAEAEAAAVAAREEEAGALRRRQCRRRRRWRRSWRGGWRRRRRRA